MKELAGTDPVSLIIGDEEIALQIKPQSVGSTVSIAVGNGFTLRSELHNATAVGRRGMHPAGSAFFVKSSSSDGAHTISRRPCS